METQNNAAFVMMLDYSGSMSSVMPLVIIDAKAFVRYCLTGDQFAINKFSDNAQWLYPTDGSITTVTGNRNQITEACTAIDTLKSSNCTNIAEAITLAQQAIVNSAIERKALVLLSDGYSNVGAAPDLAYTGNTPLYIASLGSSVWKSMFEKLKSKNPENEIYWQPTAVEMMQMFNSIRRDVTQSTLLTNSVQPYTGSDYQLEEIVVGRDEPFGQFSVVWDNAQCRYTAGIPRGYEFNVYLIDQDGKRLADVPDVISEGCCIFNKQNVKAGKWHILVQYSVESQLNIHGTIGGFIFNSKLRLNIDLPNIHELGQTLSPVLTVWDGNKKVEDVSAKIRVVRPTEESNALFNKYSPDESNGNAMRADSAKDIQAMNKRIKETLRNDMLFANGRGGNLNFHIGNTNVSGAYNLECEVTGIDPQTGKEFRMVQCKTVLIP
jgi:hypothetical protein